MKIVGSVYVYATDEHPVRSAAWTISAGAMALPSM
jgi:hypothetical protein